MEFVCLFVVNELPGYEIIKNAFVKYVHWSTSLYSLLRNAAKKCHSVTVGALVCFGALCYYIYESDNNESGKRNDENGNVCGIL
jgi:hypothetical protein